MDYSFKDIYSRAKSVVETDSYVIYQTLKSKLYFSGNYLLIEKRAYYCRRAWILYFFL